MRQSFFNFQHRPISFVGSAKATIPVSLEVFGSNSKLTIPRPTGIRVGDLMIAAVAMGTSGNPTITVPSGWTVWYNPNTGSVPKAGLYYRFVEADEDDDYTWTSSLVMQSCSGSIVAFRNATTGALAMQYEPTDPPGNHPALVAPGDIGAALLAVLFAEPGTVTSPPLSEDITADAPLTLAEVHVGHGISPMSSGTAYELNLSANEVTTGRHMDSIQSNQLDSRLFSAIIRATNGPDPVLPVVIGSEKATTPVSGSTDAGFDVTIPRPAGVATGDHMFAIIGINPLDPVFTVPDGWTFIGHTVTLHVYYKKAGSGEPSDYTWTADTADKGRSGCIVVIRGGQVILGASSTTLPLDSANETTMIGMAVQNVGIGAMTIPSLTCRSTGSMLLAFVTRVATDGDEDFTVSGGPTLLVQHAGGAASGYQTTAIAMEEDIEIGTVLSGRSFSSDAGGNRRLMSILIQPT